MNYKKHNEKDYRELSVEERIEDYMYYYTGPIHYSEYGHHLQAYNNLKDGGIVAIRFMSCLGIIPLPNQKEYTEKLGYEIVRYLKSKGIPSAVRFRIDATPGEPDPKSWDEFIFRGLICPKLTDMIIIGKGEGIQEKIDEFYPDNKHLEWEK